MTATGVNNGNWRGAEMRDYIKSAPDMNDRESALSEIKRTIGADAFRPWYDGVYNLRRNGKHAEYEQAIYTKRDELRAAFFAEQDSRAADWREEQANNRPM